MVEGLEREAKLALHLKLKDDSDAYAQLLKDLLVQGLIKMIEPKIILKCRESDLDIINSIIDDARSEYND